eukprot:GHVP01014598.1.p1 GENE.GHVP01014598.1~~GHVP01014598.1.p1  ORF type:complete len:620 (+),score=81.41 GHVP01014598.1:908-2767(+)
MQVIPMLKIYEDNNIKTLVLSASSEEHMGSILSLENSSIFIGGITEKITLNEYAMGILSKLRFPEENRVRSITLRASSMDQMKFICNLEDNSIFIGDIIDGIHFESYAASILPKLKISTDHKMEKLMCLKIESADEMVSTSLLPESSIQVGKIGHDIYLYDHSILLLSKLKISKDNIFHRLEFITNPSVDIEPLLKLDDRSIYVGKIIQLIAIRGVSLNILPKLDIPHENIITRIEFEVTSEDIIRNILELDNGSIFIGRITDKIYLERGAISILPKLIIPECSRIKELNLRTDPEDELKSILETEDSSIFIGKITKHIKLENSAVNVLRKLKIPNDSSILDLRLEAKEKKNIDPILQLKDNSIFIGSVTDCISIYKYAIGVFPKLIIPKDNTMKTLFLNSGDAKLDINPDGGPICAGKITKQIHMQGDAILLINRLEISQGNIIEELEFATYCKEHLEFILRIKDNSIYIGKVNKRISLYGYCVLILSKLIRSEESPVKELNLHLYLDEPARYILEEYEGCIPITGITDELNLYYYSINILSKLAIQENIHLKKMFLEGESQNIMEYTRYCQDNSIFIGGNVDTIQIRESISDMVPKLILPGNTKLEYKMQDRDERYW